MGKIQQVFSMVKGAPAYVKEHWNTPNEGEYVPLKEFVAYTAAQAGTYIFLTASGLMVFSAAYFCGDIMGIKAMDFSIINLISTIIGYALIFINPIGVLIYENHGRLTKSTKILAHIAYLGELVIGIACYFIPATIFESVINGLPQLVGNILVVTGIGNYFTWFIRRKFCAKHGRFKPMLLSCCIPATIIISIIPYLPVGSLPYTTKLVILHFAFTFMNFFYNNFIGVNTLVTFMTPNSQERQRLHSIVPIITGLFPSIISMFFPILIASSGGYRSITTYKIFVPIFAIIGGLITLCGAFCKERVFEASIEKREKVTFFKGAKYVLKNKYLWITKLSNVFAQWSGLVGNLLSLWFVYSLRMEWFSGVAANIVVIGMTAGNLLCPILTKKFQKRDILIVFRGISILCIFGILLAVKMNNIVIFIVSMFLRNTFQPVIDGIGIGLAADIQNYHHWKYGERCDSTSGIFDWFLNPINAGVGLILPWMLARCGFTSDWDALLDPNILKSVFSIYTWLSVVGTVLVTVPFIFYDLTKEKHDMCVEELKKRLQAQEQEDSLEQIPAGGDAQ